MVYTLLTALKSLIAVNESFWNISKKHLPWSHRDDNQTKDKATDSGDLLPQGHRIGLLLSEI